jgi:hypothetical protein
MIVVPIDIIDTHQHRRNNIPFRQCSRLLNQHNGAITNIELCTMTSHANSQTKSKGVAEPSCSSFDIRISEFRNDSTPRYGSIRQHILLRLPTMIQYHLWTNVDIRAKLEPQAFMFQMSVCHFHAPSSRFHSTTYFTSADWPSGRNSLARPTSMTLSPAR